MRGCPVLSGVVADGLAKAKAEAEQYLATPEGKAKAAARQEHEKVVHEMFSELEAIKFNSKEDK
jgi:hypothetical protein